MSNLIVRHATIDDTHSILGFINDLAVYEKAAHEVLANEAHIRETLFCDAPQAYALIAEIDQTPVGFAVYFFSYSTWLAKQGIYLEDLFVSIEHRGKGAGKAMLQELAKIAVTKDCGRLEWSVLDWNEPSIQFYKAMGAEPKNGWTVYRLTGDALNSFANKFN